MLFRFAVDNDWLAKNPFDKISSGLEVNLDNQVYVDRQTIRRVMSCCNRDSDRLILALARFGSTPRAGLFQSGLTLEKVIGTLTFELYYGLGGTGLFGEDLRCDIR